MLLRKMFRDIKNNLGPFISIFFNDYPCFIRVFGH
jgi:hypothetical protein